MRYYEIYESLQGEGSMVGTLATFVRTPGCNLDCSFCDTDWKVKGSMLSPDWLPRREVQWIWLTGGEPLIQPDVAEYVDRWRKAGHSVAVETNGTTPLPCYFDHVTLSPKVDYGKLAIKKCDDLKVVVPPHNLGEYCGVEATHKFVQPMWGRWDSVQDFLSDIHIHPPWKVSIQNHKYWGLA